MTESDQTYPLLSRFRFVNARALPSTNTPTVFHGHHHFAFLQIHVSKVVTLALRTRYFYRPLQLNGRLGVLSKVDVRHAQIAQNAEVVRVVGRGDSVMLNGLRHTAFLVERHA